MQKKAIISLSLICIVLLLGMTLTTLVFAKPPIQTKQGCQTESKDYLIDIVWSEFGPWVYEASEEEVRDFLEMIGVPQGPLMEQFVGLILADGTLVAYFGKCCFNYYIDPRDNDFPNDCCKPPDFENFPVSLGPLGGGDGNMCMCQSGLHPTPERKRYGGDIITIGPLQFVVLDGTSYLLVDQTSGEEWIAIPFPVPT
jgi:hypothetical protein